MTLAHVLYPNSRRPVDELHSSGDHLAGGDPYWQALQLRYQPEKAPATVRVVQPLEVYYERGHGYLRAFCHLRQEERHFRLDRIAELTVLHEGWSVRLLRGTHLGRWHTLTRRSAPWMCCSTSALQVGAYPNDFLPDLLTLHAQIEPGVGGVAPYPGEHFGVHLGT